jgi:nitrate reductase (NAD(P)H)
MHPDRVAGAQGLAGEQRWRGAQVEEHGSREDVWFVHEGKVYDGTKFLNDHPGGPESILIVGGQVRLQGFS